MDQRCAIKIIVRRTLAARPAKYQSVPCVWATAAPPLPVCHRLLATGKPALIARRCRYQNEWSMPRP